MLPRRDICYDGQDGRRIPSRVLHISRLNGKAVHTRVCKGRQIAHRSDSFSEDPACAFLDWDIFGFDRMKNR